MAARLAPDAAVSGTAVQQQPSQASTAACWTRVKTAMLLMGSDGMHPEYHISHALLTASSSSRWFFGVGSAGYSSLPAAAPHGQQRQAPCTKAGQCCGSVSTTQRDHQQSPATNPSPSKQSSCLRPCDTQVQTSDQQPPQPQQPNHGTCYSVRRPSCHSLPT